MYTVSAFWRMHAILMFVGIHVHRTGLISENVKVYTLEIYLLYIRYTTCTLKCVNQSTHRTHAPCSDEAIAPLLTYRTE